MKKFISSLILLLFLSTQAFAYRTITLDTNTFGKDDSCGGGSSETISVNNVSSDFMVVRTTQWDCNSVQVNMSSVTYDSVALTKLAERQRNAGGGCFEDVTIHYLAAPHTGTHNLVITYDHSSCGMYHIYSLLTGVAQTNPVVSYDQATPNCAAITRSLNALAGSVAFEVNYNANNMTPTSGQTKDDIGAYKLALADGSNALNWSLDTGCTEAQEYIGAIFAARVDNNVVTTQGSGGNVVYTHGAGGNVVYTHAS